MRAYITTLLLVIQICYARQATNFDYAKHGDDWGHDCNNKDLSKHYQSPISLSVDISDKNHDDSYLICQFPASKGFANYLNTTIYINTTTSFGNSYSYLIDDISDAFKATEMRVRVHSEHKIDDDYYDLELQIFHTELYRTSRNLKFAISLLFNVSTTADPFLQEIINGYSNTTKSAEISVDLSYLLGKNNIADFWFYKGSSTIPPCRNGQLNWLVSKKIYSLTQSQLDSITSILNPKQEQHWPGNYRRIQPLDSNIVGYNKMEAQESL